MNDIVSIRKMRPWVPAWSSACAAFPDEGEGSAGPSLPEDGVTDRAAEDFARGDNQPSLAAWNCLEFHAEIGLHKLSCRPFAIVSEPQILTAGLTERRRRERHAAPRIYFCLPYSVLKCN